MCRKRERAQDKPEKKVEEGRKKTGQFWATYARGVTTTADPQSQVAYPSSVRVPCLHPVWVFRVARQPRQATGKRVKEHMSAKSGYERNK